MLYPTIIPDLFHLLPVKISISYKFIVFLQNIKVTKFIKINQTKSTNRRLPLLDYTTKFISTFVRENIGFHLFYRFRPKTQTYEKPQENQ